MVHEKIIKRENGVQIKVRVTEDGVETYSRAAKGRFSRCFLTILTEDEIREAKKEYGAKKKAIL